MTMDDLFDEDEIERQCLMRKPICFLVVGKPGCGKTTLAEKLSSTWNSQLIDGTSTIEQAMREETKLGAEARELLLKGGDLSTDMVFNIIEDKLSSPEVQHYGYVLDGLPFLDSEGKSPGQQMTWLFGTKWKPDIIINIKIPDADLLQRISGQKVDPLSGLTYTKSVLDPPKPAKDAKFPRDDDEGNEDEEEVDREDEEEDQPTGAFASALPPAVLDRLVRRIEDSEEAASKRLQLFKKHVLHCIEGFMAAHSRQYVIELDGNLLQDDLFKALATKLTTLTVPKAPAPRRLITDEEEGEEIEGLDDDTFLDKLARTEIIGPQFRWKRSPWGRYCPVQLARGNMTHGRPEFSVGFLDKLYCLSSVDALMEFTRCPRKYLLPPQPMVPCKICIVGPPESGRTTLALQLAKHHNADIIAWKELVAPLQEKAKQENIAKVEAEETAKAISLISNKIKEQAESGENIHVSESHPEVMAIVAAAVGKVPEKPPPATTEMIVEALRTKVEELDSIKAAEGRQKKFGGWIVDGFPETREQWSIMLEQELVPDHMLVMTEPEDKEGALNARIKGLHSADTDKVHAWSKKFQEFRQHWIHLSEAIKGKAIDPIEVDCMLGEEEMLLSTVHGIEGAFRYQPTQFSALEEDADLDDDPIPGQGEEEEEEVPAEGEPELVRLGRKPWGLSRHYCPVALKDLGVLWPGNPDNAAKYRDKLYYFYSEEAKETFEQNVEKYTSPKEPIKTPPIRLFLLGPSGAGKTLAGRKLAQESGIFHISFKDYLHELIMPKLKQPFVGERFYSDDGVPPLEKVVEEEEEEEEEEDIDFKEPLSEEEMSIYQYLKGESLLEDGQLLDLLNRFWKQEPYSSTGFIMEGFPTSEMEVRTILESGLFVDAVVMMNVSSASVVKRFSSGRLENWKAKRDHYQKEMQQRKEKKRKAWEEDKQTRKQELIDEHLQSKAEKDTDDEEADEEEEAEFKEKLKEIEVEVFEEPDERKILEEEADAMERITGALIEKAEEQTESVSSLKDVFTELLVPLHTVNANRTAGVVYYSLCKSMRPYVEDRPGLIFKTSLVPEETARALTDHSYKHVSSFGYTCPVQMLDENNKYSANQPTSKLPVVLGQRVYYLSSEASRTAFLGNPHKYVTQPPPLPFMPPQIAIVGPPKSGKTSVANQLVLSLGVVRFSIGDALRYQMTQFPECSLAEQIKSYLLVGETIPDELCVAALERKILAADVNTRGMVLDGWPQTKAQVDLLKKHYILPMIMVELNVAEDSCMVRSQSKKLGRKKDEEPVLNNTAVQVMKMQSHFKHIGEVRGYYQSTHRNWHITDGEHSRWKVSSSVLGTAIPLLEEIHDYVQKIPKGKAASVCSLCLSPEELSAHMGAFESYCPVSFITRGELVDCSVDDKYTYVAEYKSKYYRFLREADLEEFLSRPDDFVPPEGKSVLPNARPRLLGEVDRSLFPKGIELQGFCPVTYVSGGCRYESLVPGSSSFAVEYKEKIFCFSGEEQREQFMRLPEKYCSLKVPAKLPPLKQSLALGSLPILGYLEQSVATTIIDALTAAGCFKPRLPFKDPYSSALTYVAFHLKAHNPNSSRYLREKYRKKLLELESECLLLKDLSTSMEPQYQDPNTRTAIFSSNLTSFLNMKQGLLA